MSSNSVDIVKPIATAGVAVILDQFIFNESDLTKSLTFGVSAGAGAYLGMMVGSSLPDLSSSLPTFLGNGKGLLQRVTEIGLGTGVGYVVNKYVMKNTSYKENIMNKIGGIIAADIAGEYIADYLAGRPLSFLA